MNTAATLGTGSQNRFDSVDVLRGTAICIMLMVNILIMGRSVWQEFSDPHAGWSAADQNVFWLNFLFLEGAGRALFTILFGASFMIMLAKTMDPGSPIGPADLYYRRCIWMLLFGILHATILLWPGDILFHYAAPAMALLPFRAAKPKHLLMLVGLLLIVLSIFRAVPDFANASVKIASDQAIAKQQMGYYVSTAEQAQVAAWQELLKEREIDRNELAIETKARGSYWSSVVYQTQTWVKWFDSQTPIWALEAFTFMLLGIALFKLGILTGTRSPQYYVGLILIVVPLSLAINGHEASVKWSTNNSPHVWWDDMTYQFGRVAMALSYIAILVYLFKRGFAWWLLSPLQTLGRMPLTCYMGQSLISAILFTGFGLFGKLNNAELWGLAAAILIGQYLFCRWWLDHYTMGPLEWVWRCLVYMKVQPLLRPRMPTALPSPNG